jgi:hypothetical protein
MTIALRVVYVASGNNEVTFKTRRKSTNSVNS